LLHLVGSSILLYLIDDARSNKIQIVAVYGNVMNRQNMTKFLHLKEHLAGKNFDDDDEVQEEVMTWFKGLAADFYDSGIQKLVPRLNKCLDNAGNYVEK